MTCSNPPTRPPPHLCTLLISCVTNIHRSTKTLYFRSLAADSVALHRIHDCVRERFAWWPSRLFRAPRSACLFRHARGRPTLPLDRSRNTRFADDALNRKGGANAHEPQPARPTSTLATRKLTWGERKRESMRSLLIPTDTWDFRLLGQNFLSN